MIKNVRLKVFLQNTVFFAFSWLNQRKKHDKKKIMLYSNMGFRDNVKALYDYLIENGYNQKYQIVCSTNDYNNFLSHVPSNVKFISNVQGIKEFLSAGFVYYCFGKLPIFHGKGQKVVQMWHGSAFKAPDEGMLKGHSFDKPYYTNVFSSSKHFAPIFSYCFSIPVEQVTICGQPRCDALYKGNPHYDFGDYRKLVLWAPTFRKSSVTGYSDSNTSNSLVPVLDSKDFGEINEKLRDLGIKVVVKLHPLQDLDQYKTMDLDHFVLLSHQEFVRRKMDLYKFMAQSDALITDYSSIFIDYLLLDRPIAFTEDDMDDYTRGFVFDNPKSYQPGFRIKTKEDFLAFAESLVNGDDDYKSERKRVMALANDYHDGKFCKRALECVGINL